MYQVIDGVRVWGTPDPGAVAQAVNCARAGAVAAVALMADHHLGYSQPIGGVVAYRGQISPSGVGYDIACGNKAVRTNLRAADVRADLGAIMDEIYSSVIFGVGGTMPTPVDHELFDDPTWREVPQLFALQELARSQLGTAGAGNHFVDLFEEEDTGALWVGVHFGSRGFGHRTATGFMNLAAGWAFDAQPPRAAMDAAPTLLSLNSELGQAYLAAMRLAGRYAYAGRDLVVEQVLRILGARAEFAVHNHHNFAWLEEHNGEELVVVRKGATPLAPGQLGFVGGSMADISVVIRGKETAEAAASLYSTIHGAGRIMSRSQALGRRRGKRRTPGAVSVEQMQTAVRNYGVELRGGGPDESPFVYRRLADVLAAHENTLEVLHTLRPIGVAMAGPERR